MKDKFYKNIKRKKMLFAVSFLLIVMTVGVTLSYMFKITDPIENDFQRAIVSCEVVETFNAVTGIKSSIQVRNTGNVPACLRVKLVSYWVDGSGDIIGEISTIPPISLNSSWEKIDDIYYYKTAVDPEGLTTDMLDADIELAVDGEKRQVIEVFAEAIQVNAVSEWGYSLP